MNVWVAMQSLHFGSAKLSGRLGRPPMNETCDRCGSFRESSVKLMAGARVRLFVMA
jgi:hypothetical protein